jgi:ATP-binding cassette subfamily A (ABC1) protein 3
MRPGLSGYLGAIAFTMALTLKFASVIAFIVKENTDKCKQQQLLSSMDIRAYWLSNFLYDYCMYIIVAAFAAAMCVIFNVQSLIQGEALTATLIIFGLFGMAGIPYTYLCSFLFKDYGIAQAVFYFFNFAIGAVLPTIVIIFRLIGGSSATTALTLCWFMRAFPTFAFGEALMNMASRK